ncbi:MAG: hypothetical protein ACMVO3_22500 [Thalassobaculum sp.]
MEATSGCLEVGRRGFVVGFMASIGIAYGGRGASASDQELSRVPGTDMEPASRDVAEALKYTGQDGSLGVSADEVFTNAVATYFDIGPREILENGDPRIVFIAKTQRVVVETFGPRGDLKKVHIGFSMAGPDDQRSSAALLAQAILRNVYGGSEAPNTWLQGVYPKVVGGPNGEVVTGSLNGIKTSVFFSSTDRSWMVFAIAPA